MGKNKLLDLKHGFIHKAKEARHIRITTQHVEAERFQTYHHKSIGRAKNT